MVGLNHSPLQRDEYGRVRTSTHAYIGIFRCFYIDEVNLRHIVKFRDSSVVIDSSQ